MDTQSHASDSIRVNRFFSNAAEFVDKNPLEVRWGFSPVARDKHLDARLTGVALVPFAKFFPIKTFNTPQEVHSIDWTMEKEKIVQVTAEAAQSAIEEALAGKGAQSPINWGLEVGFFGERDTAKMEVISVALLPTLSGIREICSELALACPIGDVCQGSDELDYGARETCVSCWYAWLSSDALQTYMREISAVGMDVEVQDPVTNEVVVERVRPTYDELEKARQIMTTAYRTGIKALEKQWKIIADEEAKNQRKDITDFEHGYRKDLHKNKPEDRQLAVVEQFAKSAGLGDNAAMLEFLAKSNEQTQQLLALLIAERQAPAAPALTPQQKAAATKAANEANKNKEQ